MILAVLALLSVTFSPPKPTVGDPITIDFKSAVILDPSETYEIVSQKETRVVIRTFAPRPLVLSGTAGGVPFRNLIIPVRSVLKPKDDLTPAPMTTPMALPYPRAPFIAIAIAALAAILTWALAWYLARRPARVVVPAIPADERYRRAVLALREDPSRADRWAALADATRVYLAETRAQLGSELTTTELVPRLDERERVVAEILRQGDMEKFSPFGAPQQDFDDVASRAMELAS